MPKQSASLEALGKRKKRHASSSGLIIEGRCVQHGCQGFGLAACMYHHMLCAVSAVSAAARESEEARKQYAADCCYVIAKGEIKRRRKK